jgi:hypothetical protein
MRRKAEKYFMEMHPINQFIIFHADKPEGQGWIGTISTLRRTSEVENYANPLHVTGTRNKPQKQTMHAQFTSERPCGLAARLERVRYCDESESDKRFGKFMYQNK